MKTTTARSLALSSVACSLAIAGCAGNRSCTEFAAGAEVYLRGGPVRAIGGTEHYAAMAALLALLVAAFALIAFVCRFGFIGDPREFRARADFDAIETVYGMGYRWKA